MRYLKTYESFKDIDIESIKDILLDLEDDGFKTDVWYYDHRYDAKSKKGRDNDFIRIKITRNESLDPYYLSIAPFHTNEIKECLFRVFDYLKQNKCRIKTKYTWHGQGKPVAIFGPYSSTTFPENKGSKDIFKDGNNIIDFFVDIEFKKWWNIL